MATCANCGSTILFGGHRVGDNRYCSPRCVMQGRTIDAIAQAGGGAAGDVAQQREDILIVAEELQQQRTSLNDVLERLDFLERAIAQVRSSVDQLRADVAKRP